MAEESKKQMYIAISLIVIAIVIIFIINKVRKSKENFKVENPSEYTVKVFTMPGCGWCKKLKDSLPTIKKKCKGINFEVKECTDNSGACANIQGFPETVIEHKGTKIDIIQGFDQNMGQSIMNSIQNFNQDSDTESFDDL